MQYIEPRRRHSERHQRAAVPCEDVAMADVSIRTRPNGPYLVEGAFKLVDSEGKEFKLDPAKSYALCRCGQSSRKPFCDGTHKTCGFVGDERAPD
jgi:CDGSH-type Zn-finger protein